MPNDRNPAVMEMVEETLRENPDYSTKDLKLKAEEIDEDIEELSIRQFNARYPLQVRRKLSAEKATSGDGEQPEGEEQPESGNGGSPGEATDAEADEDTRERVFEMIEEALRENPEVGNDELQERAAEIDSSIGELSARSFHARYPLQVKRQMASEREDEEETTTEAASGADDELRAAVRQALLDFARDVAGAEDRGRVIDVLMSVDEYVDRVVERG